MVKVSDKSIGDEDKFETNYEQSNFDKIISTLLCRSDKAKEKLEAKPVSFFRLFRYASFSDKLLVGLAIFLAILSGIGQPMVVVIAGLFTNVLLLTDQFIGNDEFWYDAFVYVYVYAAVGIAMAIITIVQYICFKNVSLNVARNIRSIYMKSLLHQNAEWYDRRKAGMITSQLNENIDKIKDGIGDKVGLILRGLVMFITSLVVGFIYEWRITLITIAMGPLSAALMSLMARIVDRITFKQMDANGRSTSIVEECIMNVRTVAACNGQQMMLDKYSASLDVARRFTLRICSYLGFFDGIFFLIMYLFLALGFL
ncbi:unnamed protein product [Dracunculus medinensis]|uniref:ABC transmembrane type-1 domain-containing protein n=1 Tax=Dracunculus medinensis TaxID=318479 RepID=A0A0N4UQN9_DRAME|nr:unnamed protein product [Dracunculus medinensis]